MKEPLREFKYIKTCGLECLKEFSSEIRCLVPYGRFFNLFFFFPFFLFCQFHLLRFFKNLIKDLGYLYFATNMMHLLNSSAHIYLRCTWYFTRGMLTVLE